MEVHTILVPALGGTGLPGAAAAVAAIGLATIAAGVAGRLSSARSRRRRTGPTAASAVRGLAATVMLSGVLALELAMLRAGGDPFAGGETAGAAVLAVNYLGFVTGVARATSPRRPSIRARRAARGA